MRYLLCTFPAILACALVACSTTEVGDTCETDVDCIFDGYVCDTRVGNNVCRRACTEATATSDCLESQVCQVLTGDRGVCIDAGTSPAEDGGDSGAGGD